MIKLNAINMNLKCTCYVSVDEYIKSLKIINIKKPLENYQIKKLL